MLRVLSILSLCLITGFGAMASKSKDILYRLSKDYSLEMWHQGTGENPSLDMNKKAYDFYFKHLYDTYKGVYKTAVEANDTDSMYKLYDKVCDLLRWKVENKEYSRMKKFVNLKKKIETYVQNNK